MSSALWLTPPHASTPECPFSAGRGLSRTSRERRERGLYLGRLQVEVPYHGVARSPLRGRVPQRGCGSPPTGGLTSPNEGFDFPQRSKASPPWGRLTTNPVANSHTEPRRTRRNLTISVSRRSSAAPLRVKNHPHPNPFRAFRVFRGYIREWPHSLCLVTQKRFFRNPLAR